jgi:DNA repair protein RecO (recombination protein O)
MRNFCTEGIILKRQNRGENDHYITLFSPLLGKISACAKGARKISSSFSGHLEPLNICTFEIYRSARSYTITQCRSTETFKRIRSDLEKTLTATMANEIFEKTAYLPDQSNELFELFKSALDHFSKSKKTALMLESFKIKLMRIIGILPDIKHCAACHNRLETDKPASIDLEGHILCEKCAVKYGSCEVIPFRVIKLINYICLCDLSAVEKIATRKSETDTLKIVADTFLHHHLERRITSEGILDKMR